MYMQQTATNISIPDIFLFIKKRGCVHVCDQMEHVSGGLRSVRAGCSAEGKGEWKKILQVNISTRVRQVRTNHCIASKSWSEKQQPQQQH